MRSPRPLTATRPHNASKLHPLPTASFADGRGLFPFLQPVLQTFQTVFSATMNPSLLSCPRGRRWVALFSLLPVLAGTAQTVSSTRTSPTPEQLEFFESKIRPVLVNHCYECHSEERDRARSDLVLDTRDGIRSGGERGPGVVPGRPEQSILLNAIRQLGQLRMPPDSRGGPLPESVVADFEKWIRDGAVDPRISARIVNAEPAQPEKPVDWEKEREFWAFQAPKPVAPPPVANAQWPKSGVDHFILAKLEEKGLQPVADADQRTLLRRVYYDLIGLPPSPAELEAFTRDDSPEALEKVVDKLLASERFGEQWGRYWLDVARYGESTGLDRNLNFPYAWRYRDYVINALNADKPYDRFIHEQLAGDQLPSEDQRQRDELLTATGFLAVGPKGLNEGRPKYSKWQVVTDQIDVTTRGFIGLTVSCAQCHDHKFDPIPARDFHALAGIFSSTDTLYGTVGGRGNRRPTTLLSLNGAPELAVLSTGEPTPNMFVNTNRNFITRTNQFAGGTNSAEPGRTNQFAGGRRGGFRGARVTNIIERIPATNTYAMGVRDYEEMQDSPIYFRGDLAKPRDIVERGFLRIVSLSNPPAIPAERSGRLELAQWITDPENPLTARVAVNRVWHQLFGEGIVATPDNFGHLGTPPTHPELLDYLALRFVNEQGWSVKKLVRSLILTRAYQLSSAVDYQALEVDPGNTLVWRATPRRLKAEQLRDSILTASGRLDLAPPHFGVTGEFGDGYYGVNIWESDLPQQFFKRSVYLPVPRDMVPESLSLFDLPNPNLVSAKREVTTSPSQALFLMNNALVQDESLHLVRRALAEEGASDPERVRKIYRATLLREPTETEVKRAQSFIQEQTELLATIPPPELPEYEPDPDSEPAQFAALISVIADTGGNTANADPNSGPVRRRPIGPGSDDATMVKKLAPGIARPKTFRQAVAERPITPEEGAWAQFAQAIFASAEFRYLQ